MQRDEDGRIAVSLDDALGRLSTLSRADLEAPIALGDLLPILAGLAHSTHVHQDGVKSLLDRAERQSETMAMQSEIASLASARVAAVEVALAILVKLLDGQISGTKQVMMSALREVKTTTSNPTLNASVVAAQERLADLIDHFPG